MSYHRDGEKISGSHTTVIEKAVPIVDHLIEDPSTTKISLGVIQNLPNKRSNGINRAKLIDESGCLVVDVTQNKSIQTLRIYSNDMQATKLSLARFLRDNHYAINFHSRV